MGKIKNRSDKRNMNKIIRKYYPKEDRSLANWSFSADDKGNVDSVNLKNLELKKIPEEINKFSNLRTLNLRENQISEITGLENLILLGTLNLSDNQITKIEGLNKLVSLNVLFLSYNSITNVNQLKYNTGLVMLDLSNNEINNIEALQGLPKLYHLNINNNKFPDTMVFKGFPHLRRLRMERNNIKKLVGLEELKNLDEIWIDKKSVSNIIGLEGFPEDKIFWWNKVCRKCQKVLQESDKVIFSSAKEYVKRERMDEWSKNISYGDMLCVKCLDVERKEFIELTKDVSSVSNAIMEELKRELMKKMVNYPP